jgi:hypothetical protein
MKNYIITKLLTSKKVWLGISSIVIPLIASALGVDEDAVSKIWWSLDAAEVKNILFSIAALVLGQGIADARK